MDRSRTAGPYWLALQISAFVMFVLAAMFFFVSTFIELDSMPVAIWDGRGWAFVAGAALAYAGSHLLRSVRLYVILMDVERSFARILRLYTALAFVNRMVPLKLGETFRFLELSHMFASARLGLVAIATERYFDALTLLWLLLYGFILDPAVAGDTAILLVILSLVAVFGSLAYKGLPGFARYLRFLAATRSRGRQGIAALRIAASLDSLGEDIAGLLRGRTVILAVVSFAVWALEIASMGLLLGALSDFTYAGFVSDLLRALNALLTPGASGALDAVGLYFFMTYVVIGMAFLPWTVLHCAARLRGFDGAMRLARRARTLYVRTPHPTARRG
jgi:hypothetical protein